MYVMEVLLQGAGPLYLAFDDEVEAYGALQRLDRDISESPDGALVTVVQDDARCVAFLKRDFRSVEISRQPNDDDGEDAHDNGDGLKRQQDPVTPPVVHERPSVEPQQRRSPLDMALNDIDALASSGKRRAP